MFFRNRTNTPAEECFSGVVSIEAVRLGFILARMNGLSVCTGDVGNAFLYGITKEKYYIIAGPEFGPDVHGRRLVIYKSIYGLKSSAARFHEHLSERLKLLGFLPSKADPDLWIKNCGDHYEYVARYVDDVIAFSKDPMKIMKALEETYVMKGVGIPQYYLGGDVVELDEQWHEQKIFTGFAAHTYIENSLKRLAKMCNISGFKGYSTPMRSDYHAELDETPFCEPSEISKYRSLIGCANWCITLGRFDINYAVTTLARYQMAPRKGHFEAMKRVWGYLQKYIKGCILVDVSQPAVKSTVKVTKGQNWSEIYPDAVEDIPADMPKPLGVGASLTTYVDADHARDKVTCRSMSGILMLLNNTPIHWVSKRQPTVETSTYGSEMVATRIAIDLIVEMRYKLRMLGVPIEGSALLLGDNMSVVLNTTIPSSPLKKKHLACAYHRIREAIAAKIVDYAHVVSGENMADLFTKPLDAGAFHHLLKKYLFRNPFSEHMERVTKRVRF